jgi:hypothetical protein
MDRMDFGKYDGRKVADVPSSYLRWCLRECDCLSEWLRCAIERELRTREGQDQPRQQERQQKTYPPPLDVAAIIGSVRRELAMKYHPDRGGSTEVMAGVNVVLDRVLQMAGVG